MDYYRNHGAYNYIYNGTEMAPTGTRALLSVENEFTMLQAPLIQPGSKIDHTGGVHGDEKTISVAFVFDGVEVNPAVSVPLTACKTANYNVISTMHNAAANPGDTVDPNHTVIAEHAKNVIFGNGGYKVTNAVTGKVNPVLPIVKMYAAIFCNGKDQATYGRNEMSKVVNLEYTGSQTTELLNKYTTEFWGHNPETDLSSYASGRIKYMKNMVEHEHFIQNRPSDSKDYIQFPPILSDTSPAPPYIELALNDTIIVESVIEFMGGE